MANKPMNFSGGSSNKSFGTASSLISPVPVSNHGVPGMKWGKTLKKDLQVKKTAQKQYKKQQEAYIASIKK